MRIEMYDLNRNCIIEPCMSFAYLPNTDDVITIKDKQYKVEYRQFYVETQTLRLWCVVE